SQDDFEVKLFDLTDQLVEHLTAVGLDFGFVEIEEGVGVINDFFRYRRRSGFGFRSLGNDGTVATRETSFGGPECVSPAEFAGAVEPGKTANVDPVVLAAAKVLRNDGRISHCAYLLSAGHSGNGGGGKRQRQGNF